MNDLSNINWYAQSDRALSERIGAFVRYHRLEQNRTQSEVAEKAGISRSTLSLLEHGEPVTVPTLIQVLRVLERLEVLSAFDVQPQRSPLELAKLERQQRKRASGDKKGDKASEIEW